MSVDPSGRFVYVSNEAQLETEPGTVAAFSINRSAATLTWMAPELESGTYSFDLAVHPNPAINAVYVADGNYVTPPAPGKIVGYTYDRGSGSLTAMSGSPFTAGLLPASIHLDPTGTFAFAPNALANTMSVYGVEATGALRSIVTVPVGRWPNSVAAAAF